jgi:hypothetical protein
MKTLQATDLPKLPQEVKNLVRDGVYALYVLSVAARGAEYLLVVRGSDRFALAGDGAIVQGDGWDLSKLPVAQAVTFSGLVDSARVNFA